MTLTSSAAAAATPVPLGAAASYAVLAGAGITNTGPTTLNGDIGTFPTTTITGAGISLNGINHNVDFDAPRAVSLAKDDLAIAYGIAAAEASVPIIGDLGGQTLSPGVYNSGSSIGLTGALTLDGGGNPNAVFVFQAGSTLTTASSSQVNLTNGAQSCNVFWQVGSSATLGTNSSFTGSILALASVTVTSGVSIEGALLAEIGTVTLDTDTVTKTACSGPTAVATRSFSAKRAQNGVSLRWGTASELQILGFNLYGQYAGKRLQLNPTLIAGKASGTSAARSYRFVDHLQGQAKPSRYWLQVVHLDGSRSWFGSARAQASH